MTQFDALTVADDMLKRARTHGAEAADAVIFESTELNVSRRMRSPETLERSENKAMGLRVFVGQKQAMVSTTDLSYGLSELAERAVAMAKASTDDPDSTLAEELLLARSVPDLDLFDGEEPTPEWLLEACAKAEDAALASPGITNSEGADGSYSASTVTLVTSPQNGSGFSGSYRSSSFSLSASILAGSGTGMERDYDYTHTRHRKDMGDGETVGKEAAKRALSRLNPRKVATCQATVIFDPRVAKSLLGSFSGAISGSSIARGTSFLKDAMGKPVFAKGIHIVDAPHRLKGLGSRPFDGEGVATQERKFVENGVLASWLLDTRTARKLKLATTGHASRGVTSPPSPASTNLYMEPGTLTPQQLLSDIASGFYVTEVFGMGVNLITGDYSQGASGFWIEKGELAYPVSEVTIAGRLQDMFLRMTPANDLNFRYVTNAPSLRVENMTVAGT